ncbi:30S ribosomal protein S6 [Candidatus Saccharibacteria bacterium]|nr:30S ribosomal protein S6 [Candidatus Saccharibacteria bacterium]
MRQYELTVLIHPDLEMNLQPALDKAKKMIEEVGGKITKEANEGKKRLAYRIAKQDFAIYYYYELDLPDDKKQAKKLADGLDIADEFIRHLLVTVDENRIKLEAKRKARKSAEGEEEEAQEDQDKEV